MVNFPRNPKLFLITSLGPACCKTSSGSGSTCSTSSLDGLFTGWLGKSTIKMIQTRVSSDEMKHIFGTNSGINPCFAVFCLKMMLPLFCAQEHAMTITVLFGFRTADKHISKPCMYLHGNTKLGMHTPSVKKRLVVSLSWLLSCLLVDSLWNPNIRWISLPKLGHVLVSFAINLRGSADHYIFHFWHGLQLCKPLHLDKCSSFGQLILFQSCWIVVSGVFQRTPEFFSLWCRLTSFYLLV